MNINSKGTYTISEDHYEMSIDYSYYYTSGSYELPPEEDMEIESVDLNGMDITDFFWDFVEDKVYQQVIEYARENN
jgi:hypothetical protein